MAKALDNGIRPLDSDYWAVYLAAAIGGALVAPAEFAREELEHALRKFGEARVVAAHLHKHIEKGEHHG